MRRLVFCLLLLTLALPAAAQEATPEPPPPAAPVLNDALPILLAARSDLELLANEQLGASRPTGWSGSLDVSNPQLAVLIRLDLELLAAASLGVETRPPEWFGAVPGTAFSIARDIRHDLELLADTLVEPAVRPPGWSGADPLMRCNRATQTLARLLEAGGYVITTDPNGGNFCHRVEIEVTQAVESRGVGSMSAPGGGGGGAPGQGSAVASSDAAIAFMDRSARRRAGIIPRDTVLIPVARSYTQFSNMMVVRGDGFEVFVDYTVTSVTQDQFEALPDVNGVSITPVCTAPWCGT